MAVGKISDASSLLENGASINYLSSFDMDRFIFLFDAILIGTLGSTVTCGSTLIAYSVGYQNNVVVISCVASACLTLCGGCSLMCMSKLSDKVSSANFLS